MQVQVLDITPLRKPELVRRLLQVWGHLLLLSAQQPPASGVSPFSQTYVQVVSLTVVVVLVVVEVLLLLPEQPEHTHVPLGGPGGPKFFDVHASGQPPRA